MSAADIEITSGTLWPERVDAAEDQRHDDHVGGQVGEERVLHRQTLVLESGGSALAIANAWALFEEFGKTASGITGIG